VRELAPAFLLQGCHLGVCQSKPTKVASFRINHLRIANFISLLF
jgi:hypothetical protein